MKIVLKAAIVACAAAIAGPAIASRWIEAGSGKGVTVFYEADTIAKSGEYLQAWEKWEYNPVTPPHEAYNKQLKDYDCANRRTRLAASVNYKADGTVISNFTWEPYERKWRVATPDSIGEAMVKAVCATQEVSGAIPPPD